MLRGDDIMIKLELIDEELMEEEFLDIEEFILHMDDSKTLRDLEKLYLSNIEKGNEEVDYQLIFDIIRNLDLQIHKGLYLSLKDHRKELVNVLLKNQFKDCGAEKISKGFREYLRRIMITYIELDEPIFIDNFCIFEEKYNSDVLKQAENQVLEGRVENRIFKEVRY